MLNLEFARLLEQDRRREIESHLRVRRLLQPDDAPDVPVVRGDRRGTSQRPPTTYGGLPDPVR